MLDVMLAVEGLKDSGQVVEIDGGCVRLMLDGIEYSRPLNKSAVICGLWCRRIHLLVRHVGLCLHCGPFAQWHVTV